MSDFLYWLSGILVTIIIAYITFKYVKKVEKTKIQQSADVMDEVRGAAFNLRDGEDLHIKDMEITQDARVMKNVIGMSFDAEGRQSARLQGVTIKQPGMEVKISDDPNVTVVINKQE